MTSPTPLYSVPEESFTPLELHDAQAEEMVLGCMLLSAAAVADIMPNLKADDFYTPVYQELFATLLDHYSHGRPWEIVAIARTLPSTTRPQLDQAALFSLASKAITPASATYYATIVKRLSGLRNIAVLLHRNLAEARRQPEPYELASSAISALTAVLAQRDNAEKTVNSVVTEALEHSAARADGTLNEDCLPTGWVELDNLLGGIRAGQLVLCAGRPGTGKSIAALDIARHLSIRRNIPVLFFSLEMSELEIGQRIIAAEASIPLSNVISGQMTQEEWHRAQRAQNVLRDAPLYIDTSANLTSAEIRARTHQMMLSAGIRLAVIDYLGLLRHPREHKMESRQVIMSDISRDLKLLAKDTVPILALAQLNRALESRNDKRPILSDLRDTGALEQDSDVVLMLHRDDVHSADSPRAGEVDIIVAKHRNGPTGIVTLANQYHMGRLQSMF